MQNYRQCIYNFINYHFKTQLTYLGLGSFQISEKKPFWTIPASCKLSLLCQEPYIYDSKFHHTLYQFQFSQTVINFICLLPKLDFAHFEFDLLYTVHFKMHFFIEQYLSIILKLLKIVARMIL